MAMAHLVLVFKSHRKRSSISSTSEKELFLLFYESYIEYTCTPVVLISSKDYVQSYVLIPRHKMAWYWRGGRALPGYCPLLPP